MPVVGVLFRCDGGAALGMGHVSRCLALAAELRDRHRCAVTFAMRDANSAGAAAVRTAGYDVTIVDGDERRDYGAALEALIATQPAAAIVVDVRDALSRAALEAIRASGVRVVTIDDGSDRRLASDLAFYPPVPQVEEMDWTSFTGRRHVGWEWVLLRREFRADAGARAVADAGAQAAADAGARAAADAGARAVADAEARAVADTGARAAADAGARAVADAGARAVADAGARAVADAGARAFQASEGGSADSLALPESESPPIDILVTMGGSDPAGMTEFTLQALELLPMALAIRVVVGPGFSRAEALADVIAHSKHSVQIARAPASLAPLMRASRMAVAAFGVSAYELAACGVPAVHLGLTDDHARSSSAFARAGAARMLGVFGRVTPAELAAAVADLMGHAGRRGEMARHASRLVDGLGAERVAALVAAGLS
jgi:spore coat polysaccharide biosynthesis predicted glycosyltransferase SpsG